MPSMEAMACGAALVTYDNGGCRDYARDGETALVAPRRDVAALAAALGRVLDDARCGDVSPRRRGVRPHGLRLGPRGRAARSALRGAQRTGRTAAALKSACITRRRSSRRKGFAMTCSIAVRCAIRRSMRSLHPVIIATGVAGAEPHRRATSQPERPGHAEVRDHEVERARSEARERRSPSSQATTRGRRRAARSLRISRPRLVVDDEHARRCARSARAPAPAGLRHGARPMGNRT